MNLHFAYIDPNSGSILLQAAIGGVLGTGFALRKFWGSIIASIRNLFRGKTSSQTPNASD